MSRDYLEVMGIPVLVGSRLRRRAIGAGRPRVMLINEALARRDFANRNPVGETVFINYFPEPWQIVGVVGNVRQFGLDSRAAASVLRGSAPVDECRCAGLPGWRLLRGAHQRRA